MSKTTTRAIEVARAWCGSEGDSGEWDTAYYDIPIDTPEDKIEEVALAECRREIAAYSAGIYDAPELDHCWIYSIPDIDDEVNDPNEEEVA